MSRPTNPPVPPRFVPRRADVGGRRLAWLEAGCGPALVYLHDAGARTLASPAFPELARDRRVALVDLPGYGRSDPPTAGGPVGWYAELLAGWLTSWLAEGATSDDGPPRRRGAGDAAPSAPARVTLCGSSLGAWLAVELAATCAPAVDALVLAAPAGTQHPGDLLLRLHQLAGGHPDLLADRAVRWRAHAGGRGATGPTEQRPAAGGGAGEAAYRSLVTAAAAWAWHPHVIAPALLRRLGRVTCPALVLHGGADPLIPLTHARAFAAALPHGRLRVLPAAGHLLVLDAPGEFLAAVRGLGPPAPAVAAGC